MKVGEQIALLREGRDISQKELAEKIGMHNSTLNRIEAGIRPIKEEELVRIADYFDVPVDYLLGRVESDGHGSWRYCGQASGGFAGQDGEHFMLFDGSQNSPLVKTNLKAQKAKYYEEYYKLMQESVRQELEAEYSKMLPSPKEAVLLEKYRHATTNIKDAISTLLGIPVASKA